MAHVDQCGVGYALTPQMVMRLAVAACDDRHTVGERVAAGAMLYEWAVVAGAANARELIRGAVAVVGGRMVGDA